MQIRAVTSSDTDAVHAIWREAGWALPGKEPEHREMVQIYLESGRGLVAELDDQPVALALTQPATMRYLSESIPVSIVAAVNTSQRVRRRGLAGRLTAQQLAAEAEDGIPAALLGMFDQGFYNRLGFGSGPPTYFVGFDPRSLKGPLECRIPCRLEISDYEAIWQARSRRYPHHGMLIPTHPTYQKAGMLEGDDGTGLGYFDGPNGTLSHGFWLEPREQEFGPYHIDFFFYETPAQFRELLGLLQTFSDQVYTFTAPEPALVQWQDLLNEPFRRSRIARGSKHQTEGKYFAWWQVRLLDLPGALALTHLPGPAVTFQLDLNDPISALLPDDSWWQGCGGSYIVTLGPESSAIRGERADLPILRASVNAFSRLWLGARSAPELALTDDLTGPPELIQQLAISALLPRPNPDWAF